MLGPLATKHIATDISKVRYPDLDLSHLYTRCLSGHPRRGIVGKPAWPLRFLPYRSRLFGSYNAFTGLEHQRATTYEVGRVRRFDFRLAVRLPRFRSIKYPMTLQASDAVSGARVTASTANAVITSSVERPVIRARLAMDLLT
jgi:hypothetical protein